MLCLLVDRDQRQFELEGSLHLLYIMQDILIPSMI
jgi:hypothetical protein